MTLATYRNGIFRPRHPEKYRGNPTLICYRSSWELKYFMELDQNPNVLEWSSEETRIRYVSPKDMKHHTYYPDVYVKKQDPSTGKIVQGLVEIKPLKDITMPTKENKTDRRFLKEVMTFAVNEAKFKAAQAYCENRGWKFQVLTEKELNIPVKVKQRT